DTPHREKLLPHQYDVASMARFIGVDSLAFISTDGLYRAMGKPGRDPQQPAFCDACFTGDYPTRLTDQEGGAGAELPLLRAVSAPGRGRAMLRRLADGFAAAGGALAFSAWPSFLQQYRVGLANRIHQLARVGGQAP